MPYTYDPDNNLVWQDDAPKADDNSLEGVLSRYNQSNFDIGSTAALIRQLGQQAGLSEAELAAAVPIFGDEHRAALNSGYTEGSNYNAIAQRAVADALRTRGTDPSRFNQATQGFVDQGTQQAQERWQATQEDDDGLGNILALAAMAVAAYVTGGAALAAFGGEAVATEAIAAGVAQVGAEAVAGVGGIDVGSLSQILGNGGYAAEAAAAATAATAAGTTAGEGALSAAEFAANAGVGAPGAMGVGEGALSAAEFAANAGPLETQIPISPEQGFAPPVENAPPLETPPPPVTEVPPTVPRSPLQTVKDAASDVSKGLSSVKTSIYQPILQSLTDAGVPWEVVQKVPAVLDSATRGGLISGITGGNALTGATIGALSSVLTTGLNIPAPLASMAASAAAGAIGMQGAGAAGGTNTISSLIDSILGTSSGTSSGASGSSSASPQPSTTTINNQPSTAMLTAAPWLQPSMMNASSKSTPPQLFGGLSAEQAQVQDSNPVFAQGQMYPTQSFEEYQPIQQTQPIPVAHGGLMHFAEGGDADLTKKMVEILSEKPEKSSTAEDQIKKYLAQASSSNSRLEFSPLLSSKLIRGRSARSEPIFSGLKNYDVPGATPSAGYSARQMQSLRQSDPIMNMSRIPFAAHGGDIHPYLANVLEKRNFKINKQMIPGPEGRYYAKHDQRGFAVGGPGTGQSDDIPTMLSDGEYVFDADTVAALGDGSTKAGSAVLDRMREEIRKHKRSAPVNDIPPKAKTAMAYLKTARKGK